MQNLLKSACVLTIIKQIFLYDRYLKLYATIRAMKQISSLSCVETLLSSAFFFWRVKILQGDYFLYYYETYPVYAPDHTVMYGAFGPPRIQAKL